MGLLHEVGYAISAVPSNFAINPKIKRQMDIRRKMMDTGKNIDWYGRSLGLWHAIM